MAEATEFSVVPFEEQISKMDNYFPNLSDKQIARVKWLWSNFACYLRMTKAELLNLFDLNSKNFEDDIAVWETASDVFVETSNSCFMPEECRVKLAYLLLGDLNKDVSQSICLAGAPVSISFLQQFYSDRLREGRQSDQNTEAP